MVIIIAESIAVAQVEEPTVRTDAGDSACHISMDESSIVKPAPTVVTLEAAIGTVLEVPFTTLTLRESAADLDITLPGRIIEMASVLTDTICTIIEIRSRSVSAELAPVMNIMEELALQMVKQFIILMKSCIELVLSGRSFFEFARTLFDNQIENIRHTKGSDQVKAYLALVEQLEMCLKELKALENASRVSEAQLMLNKLLAA